jgi:murein hydrolase activator
MALQAYRQGRQGLVKLILNQNEPSRIARLMRYNHYIIAAHKKKMIAYLATTKEINQVENQITQAVDHLKKNQAQLNQRYLSLKQLQSERLATLDKLIRSLSENEDALSKHKNDQKRLEHLLEEAARSLTTISLTTIKLPNDAKPFNSVRGQLPYPTKGRVTNSFGNPRIDDLRWSGIFISGNSGSPVVSVYYGRVIFSEYLRGHGLLLIVDHGDGYMSLYAHNQTLLKQTGDWVNRSEPIATMGNTGGQIESGLYFEIRHNGEPQNPSAWLDKKHQG